MSRKFAPVLSLLCLAFIAAVSVACGGSSHTFTEGCTGGPYNVVGNWTLTVSGSGGSSSGVGVIDSSGLAIFFQTSTTSPSPGDTVVFPTITGACSFSGTADAYATPASSGVGGTPTSTSEPVQGNVNSATSITGTISNGNTFTLAPASALSGAITPFSGQGYLGEVEGAAEPIIWNMVFTATGNNMSFNGFGAQADGSVCYMSGTFNQEGSGSAALNIFDISITSLDGGCPIGGTTTGVGFESDSDYFGMNGHAPGTYLYAVSSSSAFVLEIFQPSTAGAAIHGGRSAGDGKGRN